jgi:hypothetical protein
MTPGRERLSWTLRLREPARWGVRDGRWLAEAGKRSCLPKAASMIEEPQPQITEQARWLWETTNEEAENATEAFGFLLAQIVIELQSLQAMMSASVSRLRS